VIPSQTSIGTFDLYHDKTFIPANIPLSSSPSFDLAGADVATGAADGSPLFVNEDHSESSVETIHSSKTRARNPFLEDEGDDEGYTQASINTPSAQRSVSVKRTNPWPEDKYNTTTKKKQKEATPISITCSPEEFNDNKTENEDVTPARKKGRNTARRAEDNNDAFVYPDLQLKVNPNSEYDDTIGAKVKARTRATRARILEGFYDARKIPDRAIPQLWLPSTTPTSRTIAPTAPVVRMTPASSPFAAGNIMYLPSHSQQTNKTPRSQPVIINPTGMTYLYPEESNNFLGMTKWEQAEWKNGTRLTKDHVFHKYSPGGDQPQISVFNDYVTGQTLDCPLSDTVRIGASVLRYYEAQCDGFRNIRSWIQVNNN
jgi:hypothetical protein